MMGAFGENLSQTKLPGGQIILFHRSGSPFEQQLCLIKTWQKIVV